MDQESGIHLTGAYTEEPSTLEYVCRVFPFGEGRKFYFVDGVGGLVEIKDNDVLKMHGNGTWFALYRKPA